MQHLKSSWNMIIPQTSPHFQLQNEIRVTSQELNPFFPPNTN